MSKITQLLALCCIFVFTNHTSAQEAVGSRIAFVPDIHFHDIYADFSEEGFDGVKLEGIKQNVSIRTMEAQIHSTRLFNENYFTLIATLDDIAAKGIKLVALPGDFTDDGQPVHLRGLAKILKDYAQRYDMRFFAIPGNHDPVKPFGAAGGKPDFLGPKGEQIGIYSHDHQACHADGADRRIICSDSIAHGGYREILETMGEFGLTPDKQDILWETPFALSSSATPSLNERNYLQCADNASQQCVRVPDLSYLVEPIAGLWLLALDANVYTPTVKDGKFNFAGSGNAGYNKVLTEKPYLTGWIANLVQRAKQEGKTLIAFSHFPMGEFYDGQTASIRSLFGSEAFQLAREPLASTRGMLVETGLRLHIGGHMHMNDTSVIHSPKNTLFNIQAPSIAAYRPAYKLVSFTGNSAQVETVTIDKVPKFNSLFPAYRQEHVYLSEHAPKRVWDDSILQAEDYHAFTKSHLQALAKWRFIPAEWPDYFREEWLNLSLWEIVNLARQVHDGSCNGEMSAKACLQNTHASIEANEASQHHMHSKTVQNFITDFYLVRNAGSLAFEDISNQSRQTYEEVFLLLSKSLPPRACSSDTVNNPPCQFVKALTSAFSIYVNLNIGALDRCLIIDMSDTKSALAPQTCKLK